MTGRRVADPERPVCPECGVPTAIYGNPNGGARRYRCTRCYRRGTAADFANAVPHSSGAWEGMVIVAELPPAVTLRNPMCQRRAHNGHVHLCQYRADCEENMRRGGAALCEGVVVELCGSERVVW